MLVNAGGPRLRRARARPRALTEQGWPPRAGRQIHFQKAIRLRPKTGFDGLITRRSFSEGGQPTLTLPGHFEFRAPGAPFPFFLLPRRRGKWSAGRRRALCESALADHGVLPGRGFFQHPLDALGREALLGERQAAIEHLRIAADTAVAEREVPDPLEHDRLSLRTRHRREVAEPVTRVAAAAVAQGIEEVPAEARAGLVEVRNHLGDGGGSGVGAIKTILVDAVVGEQRRQSRAIIGLDCRRETLEQSGKIGHGVTPGCRPQPQRAAAARMLSERRQHCGSGRWRPRTSCADRRSSWRWSRSPDSRWPHCRRTTVISPTGGGTSPRGENDPMRLCCSGCEHPRQIELRDVRDAARP